MPEDRSRSRVWNLATRHYLCKSLKAIDSAKSAFDGLKFVFRERRFKSCCFPVFLCRWKSVSVVSFLFHLFVSREFIFCRHPIDLLGLMKHEFRKAIVNGLSCSESCSMASANVHSWGSSDKYLLCPVGFFNNRSCFDVEANWSNVLIKWIKLDVPGCK
jgi:hypothetical protein